MLEVDYLHTPFHLQILENSLKYGDTVALTDDNGDISFRELYELSHRFAALLRSIELSKGDSILVMLPNSSWYAIVFLGAALIGCPLSGISQDCTIEEIRYYARICNATAIVCCEENVTKVDELLNLEKTVVICCSPRKISGISVTCVVPRDMPPWHEELPNSFNDVNIEMDDPLLLPFSSGTGGRPRCVILTHKNYSAATAILKRALFDELVVSSRRRTVAVLPFYHASGFWALLYSLLDGCHTIVMKTFHPIRMLEIIEKYEIDTLNVVPSIISFLCRMDTGRFQVSSLSTVLCGSSPLGKELISSFLRKFPTVQNLVQGYGMTEFVVLSHITPLGIIEEKRLGTCGKLLPGFEAVLKDENGALINGPGCPGELYIKSPTVMRGYLNSYDAEEPFDQDGWLRTGDILYHDVDGYYYVVDRLKDIIKVNGMQVAPSEIEDVILTFPFVKEVGVIGVDDSEHGQVPKAFVVLQEGEDEQQAKKNILALVKVKLSPIKQLRGGIEIRMDLPKTGSGKVKRYALRQLYK